MLLLCCVLHDFFAAMNEATWQTVQDWEQLHCEECKHAQLLRFQGRPHDLRWAPAAAAAAAAAGLAGAAAAMYAYAIAQ
jgi:hypothetical protein